MNNFLEECFNVIQDDGHDVLYISTFGSYLYGTDNQNSKFGCISDKDFSGIFQPSLKSCLMGNIPKSYTFSTGDKDGKNSSEDIDIQFWSLQYWMELLRKGETNAIDLLYSHTYPEMIVYNSGYLERLFRHHQILFDVNEYRGRNHAMGVLQNYQKIFS
jgi:predicted nucleotidyltransferase